MIVHVTPAIFVSVLHHLRDKSKFLEEHLDAPSHTLATMSKCYLTEEADGGFALLGAAVQECKLLYLHTIQKGNGEVLVKRAIEKARALHCRYLVVHGIPNGKLYTFYCNAGFKPVSAQRTGKSVYDLTYKMRYDL